MIKDHGEAIAAQGGQLGDLQKQLEDFKRSPPRSLVSAAASALNHSETPHRSSEEEEGEAADGQESDGCLEASM